DIVNLLEYPDLPDGVYPREPRRSHHIGERGVDAGEHGLLDCLRSLLRLGVVEGRRNRQYLRHQRAEPADSRKARWKNLGMRVDLRPAAIGNLGREHDRRMAPLDRLDNVIPGAAVRDHDLVAVILVVAVDADRLAMIHREHDGRAAGPEPRVEDAR